MTSQPNQGESAVRLAGAHRPVRVAAVALVMLVALVGARPRLAAAETIVVSPATVTITAPQVGPNPAPVTVNLSNGGTAGSTLTWTAMPTQPWLQVTPYSGAFSTGTVPLSIQAIGQQAEAWNGAISATGAPSARLGHSAVWTGKEMIVWGGRKDAVTYYNDGGRYNPATNSWTGSVSTVGAPSARMRHTAVWTGTEMIIWGGTDQAGAYQSNGYRFNPETNTWSAAIATANAPNGRAGAAAVWTGSEMLVWGGYSAGMLIDAPIGRRYNPVTNVWSNMADLNLTAPGARFDCCTAWTGTEMVVWSGRNTTAYLADGGRYNPTTSVWTPLSNAGPLIPRVNPACVWTGSEMIVWSGDQGSGSMTTGARLTPTANSWSPVMTAVNAPAARSRASAVWTGREMIVWGGASGATLFADGARYQPPIQLPPLTYYGTIQITDPGASNSPQTVTVTFKVTNSAPVILSSAAANPNPVVGATTTQVSVTAADPDNAPQAVTYFWSKLSGPGTVTFTPNNSATSNNATATFSAPGTYSLVVSVADGADITTSQIDNLVVTLPNTAPTVATPVAATPAIVTAKTTALSVLGADDAGESNLTYTWSASGPAAVSFSVNGTNAAKNTVATFTRAGSYTLLATLRDAGGLATSSFTTMVVNQTYTSVAVTPTLATVLINTTQSFVALARDQFAQPLSGPPAFSWSVTGGGSINTGGMFTAGATPGGPYILTATGGGKSGTAQVTVVPANTPPTLATEARAATNPVTGATTALSVLGADDGGEAALSYTWSTTGPVAVTFSANGTNAAKNCVATFARAGSYILTATVKDAGNLTVTSAVAVTVNSTPVQITVSPATASVNLNGTQGFSALSVDQFGILQQTLPALTWTVTGGGTIAGSPLAVFTAGATAGGPYTVTATFGSAAGTATVTVVNTAPTITNGPIVAVNPVTGKTVALTGRGVDDAGESALIYTWSKVSGPGTATFSPNGTNSAQHSTATFSAVGDYVLALQIKDAGGLTASNTVAVSVAATLTTVVVTPVTVNLALNASKQFVASAKSQFGVALAPQPAFSWSLSGVGTLTAAGLYKASATAGIATVTATTGGVAGHSTVNVVNTAPVITVAAAANPNPVTTGTITALSVLAKDDSGAATLIYTWSATGPAAVTFSLNGTNAAKNTTANFTRSGSYTCTATVKDLYGLTVVSPVVVTVAAAPMTMTMSPATVTLSYGRQQLFTATVADQFGQPLAPQPAVSWTVSGGGSMATTGLFTAGTVPGGPFTVTATSGSLTANAQVTIADQPPTVAQAAAVTANPVTGTSVGISVLGADDGGEASLTYTWSATGPAPVNFDFMFYANGSHQAASGLAYFSAAGNYVLTVTIRDTHSQTVTSAVNVTVAQTMTSITVSPSGITVPLHLSMPFNATAMDQFGQPLSTQPAFTWTLSGGPTLTATGLFTAQNLYTVKATSGGITGSATVVVP